MILLERVILFRSKLLKWAMLVLQECPLEHHLLRSCMSLLFLLVCAPHVTFVRRLRQGDLLWILLKLLTLLVQDMVEATSSQSDAVTSDVDRFLFSDMGGELFGCSRADDNSPSRDSQRSGQGDSDIFRCNSSTKG
eukprot:5126444-Amphidinium_carterae.1